MQKSLLLEVGQSFFGRTKRSPFLSIMFSHVQMGLFVCSHVMVERLCISRFSSSWATPEEKLDTHFQNFAAVLLKVEENAF